VIEGSSSQLVISRVEPKYRRPLNNNQQDILRLLYKFRFSTSELIAKYLNKPNVKLVQKKLKLLEDRGYVAKRYDKSYKLRGKAARYYLTPKAARLLGRLNQLFND
jgi:predicted transcriptional regulator